MHYLRPRKGRALSKRARSAVNVQDAAADADRTDVSGSQPTFRY
jgi:hypothetical protein